MSEKYVKWERMNLESSSEESLSKSDPERRKKMERDTNNDLRKPIQQLICDVHEEISSPRSIEENLNHAVKRMVSMMGRVALAHERNSNILTRLTWVLVILTIILVILTVAMVRNWGNRIG